MGLLFRSGRATQRAKNRVTEQKGGLSTQKATNTDQKNEAPCNETVAIKQENSTNNKSSEQQTQEKEAIEIQKRVADFTAGLVFVGLLQTVILAFAACAAIKNLRIITRQTMATEKSAKANLLNVQTFINTERARVVIELVPTSTREAGKWHKEEWVRE